MTDEELLIGACEHIAERINGRCFVLVIEGSDGRTNSGGLYCCAGHAIELLTDTIDNALHAAPGEADDESVQHISPSTLTHH